MGVLGVLGVLGGVGNGQVVVTVVGVRVQFQIKISCSQSFGEIAGWGRCSIEETKK